MTKDASLHFVFGLRSPYAWIANTLVDRFLAPEQRADIAYVPFWNPRDETRVALGAIGGEFLYRDMAKDRHLYILRDIKRLAAHLGLPLAWPIDRPGCDWEAPHRLYLVAQSQGLGSEARQLLFSDRWERGLDIHDPVVLDTAARRLGIDRATMISDDVLLAPLMFAHRKRVFGIPYFIVGADKFWGCDRLAFALAAAGLPSEALAEHWLHGERTAA